MKQRSTLERRRRSAAVWDELGGCSSHGEAGSRSDGRRSTLLTWAPARFFFSSSSYPHPTSPWSPRPGQRNLWWSASGGAPWWDSKVVPLVGQKYLLPSPPPPPSPGYFLLPSTRCRRWITQGERRLAPGSSPWLTSLSPANTWAGSAAAPCRLPVRRGTWPELGAGVPSNQSRASAWEGGGPPCELLLAAAIISCAPTGGWEDDVQKQPTPMA